MPTEYGHYIKAIVCPDCNYAEPRIWGNPKVGRFDRGEGGAVCSECGAQMDVEGAGRRVYEVTQKTFFWIPYKSYKEVGFEPR